MAQMMDRDGGLDDMDRGGAAGWTLGAFVEGRGDA